MITKVTKLIRNFQSSHFLGVAFNGYFYPESKSGATNSTPFEVVKILTCLKSKSVGFPS
jgi:hypothetical protein